MSNPQPHDPIAALRYPEFRFYTLALFLAVTGFRMQGVAIVRAVAGDAVAEWRIR